MTKKDFELIARVFATHCSAPNNIREVVSSVADDMANALATTNPLFDRARFLAACEGRTRKVKGEYVRPEVATNA